MRNQSYIFPLNSSVYNQGLREYRLTPSVDGHSMLWSSVYFKPPRIEGPQGWSGQGDISGEVAEQLQRVLEAKAQLLHEEILLFRLVEQMNASSEPGAGASGILLDRYSQEFQDRNFALVNVQQSDNNAPAVNYTLNSQVHFLPAHLFACHPAIHDHFRERGQSVHGEVYS